jgi:hypothetical protein
VSNVRRLVPALLLLGVLAPAFAVAAETDGRTLPFISNDYAKALGEARARSLPLFIEAWAPW